MTVIPGPNGSGKSTIAEALRLPGEFVNADDVARGIDPVRPERVSFAAGRLVRLRTLLRQGKDFCYETTLSSRNSIATLRLAKDAGYEAGLCFVMLRDVELNVQRVAERVLGGGHDIPVETIRRRYQSSFENLASAITLADTTVVFDNSGLEGPQEVLRVADGKTIRTSLHPHLDSHQRIAKALEKSTVLRNARHE